MPVQIRRLATLLAVVALPLLVAGCAALDLQRPRVDLVDVGLEHIGLLESSIAITLRVENPNSFRLPIDRGIYTLYLGGDRVGVGRTRGPVAVPAHGSLDEQIVVQLDNRRLLSRLRSLLSGGDVDYRVDAEHYVDVTGFRDQPIRSTAEGRLDLGSAMRVTR